MVASAPYSDSPHKATRAPFLSLVKAKSKTSPPTLSKKTSRYPTSFLNSSWNTGFRVASILSSSLSHLHFSSVPAIPMTFAPYSLPIWHAKEPTEPAAPDNTSVSPVLILATTNKPFLAALTAGKRIVEYDVQSIPSSFWKGQIDPGITRNAGRGTYRCPEVLKSRAIGPPEECWHAFLGLYANEGRYYGSHNRF
jgi:hypothetical protein